MNCDNPLRAYPPDCLKKAGKVSMIRERKCGINTIAIYGVLVQGPPREHRSSQIGDRSELCGADYVGRADEYMVVGNCTLKGEGRR